VHDVTDHAAVVAAQANDRKIGVVRAGVPLHGAVAATVEGDAEPVAGRVCVGIVDQAVLYYDHIAVVGLYAVVNGIMEGVYARSKGKSILILIKLYF
jgi:hypothetical protein